MSEDLSNVRGTSPLLSCCDAVKMFTKLLDVFTRPGAIWRQLFEHSKRLQVAD